jgi:CheY-like chemotaxis protein
VRSAAELGFALAPTAESSKRRRKRSRTVSRSTGYETEESEEEDDEEDDDDFASAGRKSTKKTPKGERGSENALQVLHVASASMSAEAISRLLEGFGAKSLIRELNLSSNNFGAEGAAVLVTFLESKQRSRENTPMPLLDRLDMSNNNLGDDGTTQLTRAISKRSHVHFVDLKLSSNSIGASGIETIMNKLLQHNLISLSLDKNSIGDQGCQLVAASLQSMTALSRLNLSFNQIGSRGINSLMRSLVACESIMYLGMSGNILRISGAFALAFTLAQHPRLEELDLDNCCLGQSAQCHICAGIISNRWVPMKRLKGFAVGPPMVAIGALKPYAQNLSNEECFRIRKDEQMKTILQWMETNRHSRGQPASIDPDLVAAVGSNNQERKYLTPDFVSAINEIHGTPSQNAYFRLLGWLTQIPFDDDELTVLQKYFYDPDGGEGDRGSDGYINLKLRGDLLAALDSEAAGEIRDELPTLIPELKGSVGIDLDKLYAAAEWDTWEAVKGKVFDPAPHFVEVDEKESEELKEMAEVENVDEPEHNITDQEDSPPAGLSRAKHSLSHSESNASGLGKEKKGAKVKARITMFPQFEQQLEELKATAMEMIEEEEDPMQHQVILTQYAEASLTILRQLRYHCMNSGLDGWRHSGLKRKVLIIDDSNVTRKLVARAFEKAGFIVDTACNGAEGVEKLKASIYDIAFMDIDMPVMNGFEATKKLREWEDNMRPGARQPICALTAAYVDDFERSELMKFKEAGLDVMESKPCNIPRLFKVVDDVSPMFSDLSISVIQREQSESRLSDYSGNRSDSGGRSDPL